MPRTRILEQLIADPEHRAEILSLLDDPALLSTRAELAELKWRFWLLTVASKDDLVSAEAKEMRLLATTISRMAERQHEMEVGKQHYLHIGVTATIVDKFAAIGRQFIQDPAMRAKFADELRRAISSSLQRSSARQIAARTVSPLDESLSLEEFEEKE